MENNWVWEIVYKAVIILFMIVVLNDINEINQKIEHIEENFTVEGSK